MLFSKPMRRVCQKQWPWVQTDNKLTEHDTLHPTPLMTSIVEWVLLMGQSQVMRDEAECLCATYLTLRKSSAMGPLQFSLNGLAICILWWSYISLMVSPSLITIVNYLVSNLEKRNRCWLAQSALLQSSVIRSVWAHIPYVWVTVPVGNQIGTSLMWWYHKQHFWNCSIITFS